MKRVLSYIITLSMQEIGRSMSKLQLAAMQLDVMSHKWLQLGNYSEMTRLRPSRKFLEKLKIIFFSNFSRNYFRAIQEIRETRLEVIFVF
jgi:hypothetical protein